MRSPEPFTIGATTIDDVNINYQIILLVKEMGVNNPNGRSGYRAQLADNLVCRLGKGRETPREVRSLRKRYIEREGF